MKKILQPTLPSFYYFYLQQEANRKLGLLPSKPMRTAQALYEQGLITYMRTDSPALSAEALKGLEPWLLTFLAKNIYRSAKTICFQIQQAQEAHEAIRPAGENFVHPNESGWMVLNSNFMI